MVIQKIGNLLDGSIRRAGIQEEITASHIIEDFKNITAETWGRQALERIKPRYLRRGTLTVEVLDSVYAAEIGFKEKKIIEMINSQYKKTAVKKLRIQIR
ncbi:MAG: hypothetical protein COY66_02530 [Candidatus Kerfeldbacteria bacterium CG_4_10_14_0_8_um_filter_42_10]|uniref:DUF721 domain-containing protein n=1 Tax=Candidatus Kerfeldbacteria bacterium CG_4_10_14_0_8_um_filter_42_10 TaxID=2014248 RepID=A0A2M7RJX9_9BACT|nr:MAG: hypothetical protein COY66_02530 [Candidatus Kerfeldbacteria bacterium CG_4_10_14_0_8_um_filter_42_10]